MDHADPPLAGSLEPLHDSLAGTDSGLGEKYTMNAHRTSTEMSWGRGTAPFPRPHPQEQNAAVYTKVWTYLTTAIRSPLRWMLLRILTRPFRHSLPQPRC